VSATPGVKRHVQLALIEGLERPVGRLLPSAIPGTNADLIAQVAPLYLSGSVLDVTYGRGMWWRRYTPARFAFHDITLDGVDFRELPYADASWDAVCFDPPYVPRQGTAPPQRLRDARFRTHYGLDVPRSRADLGILIEQGVAECARVARRWVLVKCCDYVNGKQFHVGHYDVLRWADASGLRCHDLIVHLAGPGPGGSQITEVRRSRRVHSYLLVFSKRRLGRKMEA
jgi:hypothetical protein